MKLNIISNLIKSIPFNFSHEIFLYRSFSFCYTIHGCLRLKSFAKNTNKRWNKPVKTGFRWNKSVKLFVQINQKQKIALKLWQFEISPEFDQILRLPMRCINLDDFIFTNFQKFGFSSPNVICCRNNYPTEFTICLAWNLYVTCVQ